MMRAHAEGAEVPNQGASSTMDFPRPTAQRDISSSMPTDTPIEVWHSSARKMALILLGVSALLILAISAWDLVGLLISLTVIGVMCVIALPFLRWKVVATHDGVLVQHMISRTVIPWSRISGLHVRTVGRSWLITTTDGTQVPSHVFSAPLRFKQDVPANLFLAIAQDHGAPLVSTNRIGSTTELKNYRDRNAPTGNAIATARGSFLPIYVFTALPMLVICPLVFVGTMDSGVIGYLWMSMSIAGELAMLSVLFLRFKLLAYPTGLVLRGGGQKHFIPWDQFSGFDNQCLTTTTGAAIPLAVLGISVATDNALQEKFLDIARAHGAPLAN